MARASDQARALRRELRFLASLRPLPLRVAAFQWRARRLAVRIGDSFSLASSTRPDKLAVLLKEARGRRHVVELGTATAWTSLSLLLDDTGRTVISYDPVVRPEREQYRLLAGPEVARRLRFVEAPGEAGPTRPVAVDAGTPAADPGGVEMLYIDSSHSREGTLRELEAWRPALAPEAVVIFDDYGHPQYPGVQEAVRELGLGGVERAGLFVHRIPAAGGG